MLASDGFRAIGALAAALGGAVALSAWAPELRAAGMLPEPAEPRELVYTVIDLTESVDTRRACPLDLAAARGKIERQLMRLGVDPVYSPIAEGPDVLTHEIRADRDAACRWSVRARLDGYSTAEQSDARGAPLSSLERIGHEVRPLLARRDRLPAR